MKHLLNDGSQFIFTLHCFVPNCNIFPETEKYVRKVLTLLEWIVDVTIVNLLTAVLDIIYTDKVLLILY